MSSAARFSPLNAVHLLRSAGDAIFVQAGLHTQLARVELAEEKSRLTRMAIAGFIGFISAQCLLLSLGMMTLVLGSRTPYEIPIMTTILLCYLTLCTAAAYYFKRQAALGGASFAATRQEICADLAMLRAKL